MEQLFNLVVQENLILKDRGCNIEKSLEHLTSSLYSERASADEEKNLLSSVQAFVNETDSLLSTISALQAQVDSLKSSAIVDHNELLCTLEEKDLIIAKFKEKASKLEKALMLNNKQIDSLRNLLEKTRKDMDLLSHEYILARRRILMLQPAVSEKICVNCKKPFNEDENFNWSCKVHTGEYSGNAWWCCGKSSKSDEGCSITKHCCEAEQDDEAQLAACSKLICSSCKEKGHNSFNCPKDPNLKTANEIIEEVMRMETLAVRKQAKKVSIGEFNENLRRASVLRQGESQPHKVDVIKLCQVSGFGDIEEMKKSLGNQAVNVMSKRVSLYGADVPIDGFVYKKTKVTKKYS